MNKKRGPFYSFNYVLFDSPSLFVASYCFHCVFFSFLCVFLIPLGKHKKVHALVSIYAFPTQKIGCGVHGWTGHMYRKFLLALQGFGWLGAGDGDRGVGWEDKNYVPRAAASLDSFEK